MNPLETLAPGEAYGILLAALRALGVLYQTYHWRSKGPPFFGDHLMFERLYGGVLEDIDALAERIVGLWGSDPIDPVRQTRIMHNITEELSSGDDDVSKAYAAEQRFLALTDAVVKSLRPSRGTDNLLAGIQDRHEANMYLLSRRDDYAR